MVLANLQLGDVNEAERWLDLTAPERFVDDAGVFTYGLGVRAEIRLARGEVDAGLGLWRRAVETLRHAVASRIRTDPLTADPWTLEARAVTVVAHAQHGRADQVEDVVSDLRTALTAMLTHPTDRPPPHLMEFRVSGAILLALATINLHNGRTALGARLTALAERFHFVRSFQPTMSPERARRAAIDGDRSAYDDAVSLYADLGPDELRAAALELLRAP
jgi:hypothetical protein